MYNEVDIIARVEDLEYLSSLKRNGGSGGTGPRGATGPAGPTGTAGTAGATGPAGANGATGSAGAVGPTGAAGPTGSPGPAPNGTGVVITRANVASVSPRFDVTLFGATGNGVTDDTASIVAADAAAVAAGGGTVYFPTPSVAYLVTAELVPSRGLTWEGQAVTLNAGAVGNCVIQAGAAIRSVIAVRTTSAVVEVNPPPIQIKNLTFDANNLATYGVLLNSAWLARFDRCNAINAKDNWHAIGHRVPPVLSAVTQTGPGPAITISQPDPGYSGFFGGGVHSIVAKIGPDATHYQTSFDGGSTFQAAQQFISNPSNLCITSSTLFLYASGVQLAPQAGAYTIGTTYAFTVTIATEDDGTPSAINADIRYNDCFGVLCGDIYASAGSAGNYTAGLHARTVNTEPGTITATVANPVLVGVGTNFITSSGAREGDWIIVNGVQFPIACVLDNTHIAVVKSEFVLFSGSGFDYAIGVGAAYFEDANPENVRAVFNQGLFRSGPALMRFAGPLGPLVIQPRLEEMGMVGLTQNCASQNATRYLYLHPHMETGATNSVAAYFAATAVGGSVIEPAENWSAVGFGSCFQLLEGQAVPLGNPTTMVPVYSDNYVASSVTITASTTQIPAPSTQLPLNATSLVFMDATADFTLNNSHPIQSPQAASGSNGGLDGTRITIINISVHTITFSPAGTNLKMANQVAVGPGQAISFITRNVLWQQSDPGLPGATVTTIGAAGGASPLPATPLGYLQTTIANVPVSIPFYNP